MADESIRSSLKDIEYRLFYSPADKPLQTFYLPTLAASVSYDRSAGYFRSSALAAAAAGIVRLIANNGRMRLLVGAQLSEDDVAAIQHGYDLKERLAANMLGAFPDPAGPLKQRLEALAWMVANGALDIKVVLPLDKEGFPIPGLVAQDYYHTKKGIFTDAAGDQVGFSGSVNESEQGWQHNFEEFTVSRSWGDPSERAILAHYQASFNHLWEGRDPDWLAVDIPLAVKERLLSLTPSQMPVHDPLEPREPQIRDGRLGFPVATREERVLFQFLRDAPYLPSARDLAEQTSAITPWPHQTSVARSILKRFPDNVILCDEVGLGKTIEAGLVIRQLVLSGRVKRCLILTPAGVMSQWQGELYEKFNLNVPLFDKGAILDVRQEPLAFSAKPWNDWNLLIASSHLVRRRERVEELLAAEPWDLLVVDEAHHARRKDFKQPAYRPNRLLDTLNRLKQERKFDAVLLMTATPMQVHPVEVWDLLTVLGISGRWGADETGFLEFFTQLRQSYPDVEWDFVYAMVADYLHPDGQIDHDFRAQMTAALGPAITNAICRLPYQHQGLAHTIHTLPPKARPYVVEMARRHTPVKHFVYRNTRDLLRQYVKQGLLKANVPRRQPHMERIPFRGEEEALYLRIDEYISDFYQRYEAERKGLGFIMTVYRRRLTSSFYAVRRSLERRRAWLQGFLTSSDQLLQQEELDWDEEVLEELEQAELDLEELEQLSDRQKAYFQLELSYLDDFIGDLQNLSQADSKLAFLKDQLDQLFKTRDTVMVFTQYTDTMDYLRDELCTVYGNSVACYSGRGGEQWNGIAWVKTTKEIVKNAFRESRIKILLCTESASEGLNLQTCGILINYDMPWNPMRVEQRIGRIDRIGQKFPVVWIYNYFYRESIEDQIYQALQDRINWFETVVGDLQPILAEVGELTARLAMLPAERRQAELEEEMKALRARIDQEQMQAFKLDENLQHEQPELTSQTPLRLPDLERVLLNAQATAPFFTPHASIPDAYVLQWNDAGADVTFSKERFDEFPDTLQFMSYGSPLLDALLASVPEPEVYPAGIYRRRIDDPVPVCAWYQASAEEVSSVERLSALQQLLGQASNWQPGDAGNAAVEDAFGKQAADIRRIYEDRRAKRIEARKKTLSAKARQLLLQAAMVEIALGRQPNLFASEPYPTSFTEQAVTGLGRHGKIWGWMLVIGPGHGLRPREDDHYFQKIQNHSPEKLKGLFSALTSEAKAVVLEWNKLSEKE